MMHNQIHMFCKKSILVLLLFLINAVCTSCTPGNNTCPASSSKEEIENSEVSIPASTNAREKILFQSDSDGDFDIYITDKEGKNTVNLTADSANDEYPVWSLDKQYIYFHSNRDNHWNIYRMKNDGTEEECLTDDLANYYSPAPSPDGKTVLLDSDLSGKLGIYELSLPAKKLRPFLVQTPSKENILAHWSSDGKYVVFASRRSGKKKPDSVWHIHLLEVASMIEKRLTGAGGGCRPRWSPDMTRIAYVSTESDGKGDIWIMNRDGSHPVRLTESVDYDYHPTWSPDGQKILYSHTAEKRKGDWDLYMIDIFTKIPVLFLGGKDRANHPYWF